jgi:hypothetical protein
MVHSIIEDGFEAVPSLLSEAEVGALRVVLSTLKIAPGHRNLMQRVPEVAALARSPTILRRLGNLLGTEPVTGGLGVGRSITEVF